MERLLTCPGSASGAVTGLGLEPTPVCSQTRIPSSSRGLFPLCREIQFTLFPSLPPRTQRGRPRPQLSCGRDTTCLPGTRVPGLSTCVLASGAAGGGGPWPRGSGPFLFPRWTSPHWTGHTWMGPGRGTRHGGRSREWVPVHQPKPPRLPAVLAAQSGLPGGAPGRSEKPLLAEAQATVREQQREQTRAPLRGQRLLQKGGEARKCS